jgi:secondary thiamine-phosphate synthase enzyme
VAEIIRLSTTRDRECIDLTRQVADIVARSGVSQGICQVYSLHATASIIVNENADPNIGVDLLTALESAVPRHAGWLHDKIDDNAQSHILASILGASETIPVEDGKLLLGTWQAIMLVELDGPRDARRVAVQLVASR